MQEDTRTDENEKTTEAAGQDERLVMRCRGIIKCDTARITKPCKRMYLVIGFNRNTRGDEGQWIKNGKSYDFDYVAETTVASGETREELIASAREYKRLCDITMEDYLKDLTA